MSWNDERVDLLSRLWMEGRSASQIAAELGGGVTRNAVIGKVHRLGLSGRAKVAQTQAANRLRPVKPLARADELPAPALDAVAPALPTSLPPVAPRAHTGDVVIPLSNRVTIMELRDSMCRWPLGDPSSAEFRYCGSRAGVMGPYCEQHARLAFQPAQERRRAERIARIA